MTEWREEDVAWLCTPECREAVERCLELDPATVALDGRVPHAALVATQVKYLQRARRKLPSYYRARCILPPRAFEQSSSEECARHKSYSGSRCLDLTCGLGVDACFLSRSFGRVVALERDPVLAAVARENFARLGISNVEVACVPAEEYVRNCTERFDLVYADPDRRSEAGRKLVRLEECSPDMTALLPRLRELAPRIVVKNSPLFDVDEAFRLFAPARVEVVSLGGECKEVMAETGRSVGEPLLRATAVGIGSAEFSPDELRGGMACAEFRPESCRYLLIPDAALLKARVARRHTVRVAPGAYIESDNGYGFDTRIPEGFIGRVYAIESLEPYAPRTLKRRFKAEGVRRITVFKRDFPLPADRIAAALGVREGGETCFAFTKTAGTLWAIRLKSLHL